MNPGSRIRQTCIFEPFFGDPARSVWRYAEAVTISVGRLQRLASPERERLERRARLLAWSGNTWHLIEFAIAIGAGITAGSVALIAFGADSMIEGLAGFVIVWLFTGSRLHSETAERRAQQVIAASYLLLAAYVAVASVRDLVSGTSPACLGSELDSLR